MTRPFCPAMCWMIFAVGTAMCLAAFSQGGNAGPASSPSEPATRDVFQATFDGREGQDLANMGKATGRVAIEAGAGNPGTALQLSDSAGFELAAPIQTRPGFTYQVSWDCRTQDVEGMALVMLARDNRPEPMDGVAQGGTFAWSRHEFVFAGDGQPATLSFMLRGSGTAWFDNLAVHEFETYPKRSLLNAGNCFIVKRDAAATVWINYPVEKIFPGDASPRESAQKPAIEIDAARNEREAFQLVVTPTEKPLAVELSFSDLQGPQTLDARQWTCHRVDYVDVPAGYINVPYGRPGPNPDPLPRATNLKAGKNRNGVFWLTLSVPDECKPGVYQGALKLRGDVACEIPLRLQVRNFALPATPTVCSLAVYRESAPKLDPRPRDVAFNDSLENATVHRMENESWDNGLDPNWAQIRDGQLELDFASFDQALQRALDHGAQYIRIPKIHMRGQRGPNFTVSPWMGLEPFSPDFERLFVDYCRRIGDHLRETGALKKAMFYPWDEPDPREYETVKRICALIKQGCPEAPIFMAGPSMPVPDFYAMVSGWTLNFRRPVSEAAMKRAVERAGQGDVVGAYGNDRYRIDYPLAWARLWGWTLKKYNMIQTGWFAVNLWGEDPWKDALPVHSPMVAPMPGAAFLLYPPGGGDDRFVNSLRWEAIAAGLQDYEHLALLERLGNARQSGEGTQRVQEIIGQVVGGPGAFQCAAEMSRVQELRRMVDDEIERLGGGVAEEQRK